ncbi:MAG: F0F1 ATP synthase subunit epsilon [Candidatus Korobacteraceae bacterium]|jgi:F-type H+-transporting ATPase subunit epsilon
MADTLHLQIVTPDKQLVREDADQVQIPGKSGYLGILPGHAPLITELMIGELSYSHGGTTRYFAVSWGFAEVLPDKVTILADVAERAEDIDVARAQEAKARAEEALRQAAADLDFDATLYALRRAQVRLEVAARAGHAAVAAH